MDIEFCRWKYKTISFITALSAVCNVVLNLVLIPIYGGIGAALAFLVTSAIQTISYVVALKRNIISFPILKLLFFYAVSMVIFFGVKFVTNSIMLCFTLSITLYILFCIILQQISKKHLMVIKSLLSK